MNRIWTMDAKAQAVIQQLQPYKCGHYELALLNELARLDRHQSLRVIGGSVPQVTVGWRKRGSLRPFTVDPSVVKGKFHVSISGSFVDGTELGRFRFKEPEMEMKFDYPRYVVFSDDTRAVGENVLGALNNVRRYIERNLVPKLKRLF